MHQRYWLDYDPVAVLVNGIGMIELARLERLTRYRPFITGLRIP